MILGYIYITDKYYYEVKRSFFFGNVIYIGKTNCKDINDNKIKQNIKSHKHILVEELGKICLEHNVIFDNWNSLIPPFTKEETVQIEQMVINYVNHHKLSSKL